MKIIQSPSFARRVKKLSKAQKKILDAQIKKIAADLKTGEEKKGDLSGIFVHKFTLNNIQYLLSYRFNPDILELIMLGTYENYYRDLKNYIKSK